MPHPEPPRIWRSHVREPWPRSLRILAAVLFVSLAAWGAVQTAKNLPKNWRRQRVRVTMDRMRDLAVAFESSPARSRAGCIDRATEFFGKAASALPREALLDGWGNEIGLVASESRYIVSSLGSDGTADRERPGGGVEVDAADLLYSNGEWLQYPDIHVTPPALTPAEAFAEVAACTGQVPGCQLSSPLVERAIAQKAKALHGTEYCQFRHYDAIHDFDGDGREDFLVTFHVEGPQSGGNHVLAFLLAFLSSRRSAAPLELTVGERGKFLPDSIASDGKHIVVHGQTWVAGDALCCPSGSSELVIAVDPERGLRPFSSPTRGSGTGTE